MFWSLIQIKIFSDPQDKKNEFSEKVIFNQMTSQSLKIASLFMVSNILQ